VKSALSALALLLLAPAADAPVTVHTSLDRTAVWVADRVTYTIELTCGKGVDILADDLGRDKLKLDGLEMLGSDTEKTVAASDVTVYRFNYHLTTYRVDVPTLRIGGLSVRYYVKRPGLRLEDAAPAGDVPVPAAVIAFRSVIPEEGEGALRDLRPAAPRSARFAMLESVGIALVVVSIAPTVFLGAFLIARATRRRAHRSARQVRREEHASLEEVRGLDLRSPVERRTAYARMNGLVRQHLRDAFGVAGPTLTPSEIAPALAGRDRVPADLVASVLNGCALALYAPPDSLPSEDACREAVAHTEQILAIR
jgi:hypothetical protein